MFDALNAFEIWALLWLNSKLASPALDAVMRAVSRLGDGGIVFIALALILFFVPRTRVYGAVLATALLLDLLAVNVVLKPLFARVRPHDFSGLIELVIRAPRDFSFPSGHTAAAFAAAGAMSACGKRAHIVALIFAALMGLSRVYLMAHFPSDVLAGALIGSLCGLFAVEIWKFIAKKPFGEAE